jgi:Zn-dependent peptidase ImmA (M78 family)
MRNKGLHLSEAYMKKRYISDRKSPEDIAKECGVSVQLIYRQLKKFGLKR